VVVLEECVDSFLHCFMEFTEIYIKFDKKCIQLLLSSLLTLNSPWFREYWQFIADELSNVVFF